MKRTGLAALLIGFGLAASACSAHYVRTAEMPAGVRPTPATSLSRHVVVVSVDGLRPDAIGAFKAPTFQRLIAEGSYSLTASTIHPSKTLPSHTSMLTGQSPEQHGVTWNNVLSADADTVHVPNVFGVARSHGYRTAAFFSKAKFQPLQVPNTLDYSQAPGGWWGRWSGARAVADVATYLRGGARPNLLFVHLTDPDAAGHRDGWMSPGYGRGVLAADAALATLLRTLDDTLGAGNFSLIVTADHGGHDTNHGSDDPRDVTIPWIAWGRGVKPGELTNVTVRTMDTAATALFLLGLERPESWVGGPVSGAYGAPASSGAPSSGR